jgi:hypothetical protein
VPSQYSASIFRWADGPDPVGAPLGEAAVGEEGGQAPLRDRVDHLPFDGIDGAPGAPETWVSSWNTGFEGDFNTFGSDSPDFSTQDSRTPRRRTDCSLILL